MASFLSHLQNKDTCESGKLNGSSRYDIKYNDEIGQLSPVNEGDTSSPESTISYCDTQQEIFHHRHGLLVLHLLAALMFVPSLVAWFQRIDIGKSFPCFLDSVLCTGVILHGICDSKPEFNFFLFPIPGVPFWEVRLSFAYLLAGYFTYLSALALAPYRAFYAMAAIGIISFTFRIIQIRKRKNGETYHRSRKHHHRH